MRVPFVFRASLNGELTGVDITFNYKTLYRSAMERAKKRGKVSEFSEAYIAIQNDLEIARLKFTRNPSDIIEIDGDTVRIFIAATNR